MLRETKGLYYLTIVTFFIFYIFSFGVKKTNAACNPPECPGSFGSCGTGETCSGGGCCVNSGGSGGSGGSCTWVCGGPGDCDKSPAGCSGPTGGCHGNDSECGSGSGGGGSCTQSAPSTPALVSPANGASEPTTAVLLDWNAVSSWGNTCGTTTKRYRVYVESGDSTPDVLRATLGSTVTSYIFNGQYNTSYYWRIVAHNGVLGKSSSTRTFNILAAPNPDPWWQVKDSDITSMGDISSAVASGNFLGLSGSGGYPGVVAYAGSASFGSGSVSQTGWQANSSSTNLKTYDYNFFARQIPDTTIINSINIVDSATLTSGTTSPDGYRWYKYTGVGTPSIDSAVDVGSNKVVLLIEAANLNINANINLTTGFFGLIVNGSISINPNVTSLEGIYLADGIISTGTLGADLDSALNVRGSMAAYGGLNLQRDLTNNTAPAEFFEYAPDQILLFPPKISLKKLDWKEVAP